MKILGTHRIGVEQGDVVLFSDFENGGAMWTGKGPRERATKVRFSQPYRSPPSVQVSVSLWDVDTSSALRAEIVARSVACDSFEIVFRTWLDTRLARLRVSWMAIGEVSHDDDWDID